MTKIFLSHTRDISIQFQVLGSSPISVQNHEAVVNEELKPREGTMTGQGSHSQCLELFPGWKVSVPTEAPKSALGQFHL